MAEDFWKWCGFLFSVFISFIGRVKYINVSKPEDFLRPVCLKYITTTNKLNFFCSVCLYLLSYRGQTETLDIRSRCTDLKHIMYYIGKLTCYSPLSEKHPDWNWVHASNVARICACFCLLWIILPPEVHDGHYYVVLKANTCIKNGYSENYERYSGGCHKTNDYVPAYRQVCWSNCASVTLQFPEHVENIFKLNLVDGALVEWLSKCYGHNIAYERNVCNVYLPATGPGKHE